MSLINDALKRAEKSLNNNSPDQHRERIPSFDFEASKKNRKLFVILLIGGTLFFSALIALIMLLRSSPEPVTKTPPPSTSNAEVPAVIREAEVTTEDTEGTNLKTLEREQDLDQEPAEVENDNTGAKGSDVNKPEMPESSDKVESAAAGSAVSEPKKSMNEEMMEGLVGLASKAFVQSSGGKDGKQAQETEKESPKANYTLSTAQETLAMLEAQAKNNKSTYTIQDPIEEYVQNLSITGVMIADDGSQVLINNQVYSTNAKIDPALNLELIDIKPHKLTIKAANGKVYTKEF